MRVTNQMITGTVIYNLQRGISRFLELENQMSTGRKINTASDDAVGTVKSLSLRTTLNRIEQFEKNIAHGKTWLSHVDISMNEIGGLLQSANELSVELGNEHHQPEALLAGSVEIEAIFDQLMRVGNTQIDNKYVFAGHRTRNPAFVSQGMGVVYDGDNGQVELEVEENSKVGINVIGSNFLTAPFTVLGEDADMNPGISGTTVLSSLNAGSGIDLVPGTIVIRDLNLGISATVDLSGLAANSTINDVINEINTQLPAALPPIANMTAQLGSDGNNINLVATDRNEIAGVTPLANLNQGGGIDMDPGEIRIHTADDSIDFTVDLTNASTIQDVIDELNAEFTGHSDPAVNNVVVSLNPAGTGLRIQDTNGTPLGLLVDEVSVEGQTAVHLGIEGFIGADMIGADLNPIPDFSIEESAVGETTATDLGLVGSMNYNLVGGDLNPDLTVDTPVSLLNNGLGYNLGIIEIHQGDVSTTVDLSDPTIVTVQDMINAINASAADLTASINPTGKGIQIVNADPTKTLVIKDQTGGTTARELGIEGSPDVLGSLILLKHYMDTGDQEGIRTSLKPLTEGLDAVLTERASAGSKLMRLESTEAKHVDLKLNFTRLLSDTEDADITQLVADLATQETAYQAALQAAAKVIQPSLLDFLR